MNIGRPYSHLVVAQISPTQQLTCVHHEAAMECVWMLTTHDVCKYVFVNSVVVNMRASCVGCAEMITTPGSVNVHLTGCVSVME